jgi:uncharacterized protein
LTSIAPAGNALPVTKLDPTPWRATPSGLRIEIQARPGRPKTRPTGVKPLAEGDVALAVDVAAPPEDGKANEALVAALARALAVPRSAVRIATGASARRKSLHVEGDAVQLAERLTAWVRAAGL